jgi:hypothetical protein
MAQGSGDDLFDTIQMETLHRVGAHARNPVFAFWIICAADVDSAYDDGEGDLGVVFLVVVFAECVGSFVVFVFCSSLFGARFEAVLQGRGFCSGSNNRVFSCFFLILFAQTYVVEVDAHDKAVVFVCGKIVLVIEIS